MLNPRLSVSVFSLTTALLVAVPFTSFAKETPFIALQSQTEWEATMIDGASADSAYCALAQKYDQGVVLTLGQSMRDEYSLAIDFQNEKLNTEKAYPVTLQPGPGQIRAYEMMPASAQAMVVRLGYDESFLQSLEKSNHLKAEIGGKAYEFSLKNMTQGRAELSKCMAGLKGESVTNTASSFSAEKIKNAEPIDLVKEKADVVAVVPAEKIEEKIEEKIKEAQKEIEVPKQEKKVQQLKSIEMVRVDSKAIAPAEDLPPVRFESGPVIEVPEPIILKPKEAVEIKPEVKLEAIKTAVIVPDAPKLEEVKTKPAPEPVVQKEVAKPVEKIRVSKVPEMMKRDFARPDAVAAKDKKYGEVKRIASKPVSLAEPVKMAMVEEAKEVIPAKVEKPKAVKEIKMEKTQVKVTPVVEKVIEAPVQKIEEKISPKALEKIVEKTPRPPEDAAVKKIKVAKPDPRSLKVEKDLADVQTQLKEMEKENRALYLEARKSRSAIDTAVVETSNEALKKIRAYERKLEAAQADNLVLSREVESMRRAEEDGRLNVVAGDVGAEQSVRRYNEAEREIKRLGLLLEQQRLSHRQEREELEGMLFDPAVTDQAQRRKLSDLEGKLIEAEKRLQLESQKVKQADAGSQKKLQELERKLAEAKQKELQLKVEEQKVKIEAEKIAASEEKSTVLAQKEKALQAKEQRLAIESKQLLVESKKLADAEVVLAKTQAKERELKVTEAKIHAEAQRVAMAEAKLEEAHQKEQKAQAALLQTQAKERALKVAEFRMRAEAQRVAMAEAKLEEANQKEQQAQAALLQTRAKERELKVAEARMRAEAHKIEMAEVKLKETHRKAQELKIKEDALRAKEKAVASAEARAKITTDAKLAAVNKKEKEIKAAEKRLSEQSKKIASSARERLVSKAPAKVSSPVEQRRPVSKSISANPAPVARIAPPPPPPAFSKKDIQELLNRSGLSSVSAVTQKASDRYSWNAAGMAGIAEVAAKGRNMNQFIQNYMVRQKKQCNGDFASLPATVPNGKKGFEIACVGATGGKSASVVFAQKDGSFIAITHGTTADNMDSAIDARDKVAASL